MGTMANVTRADVDEGIKRLQELRETLPEGGELIEVPIIGWQNTKISPIKPAIRALVGGYLTELRAILSNNSEPRK